MSTDKLVEDHRKMVAMTGNLSDFQLVQLKAWPKIVIDDKYVSEVKVTYDFTRKNDEDREELHAGKVIYDFHFINGVPYPKEELKKRLQNLVNWTKYLFWEDTEVEIKKQGRAWQSWKK